MAQALSIGSDDRSTNAQMEHITLDGLKHDGHIPLAFHRDPEAHPFQPYTSGSSNTPSGKIEFYSEVLASQGLDPLPAFVPNSESRWSKGAERYPLEFLPRKADNYMNSTFANLDGHRKMEARTAQKLEIHPLDAQPRGIADGDQVRIFNDRGSLTLTALVNGSVAPGVVAARLDWAKLHPEANNVNALTSERLTDLGRAPTFYSTLVEVEKQEVGNREQGSSKKMDAAPAFALRLATEEDIPALHALIEASVRGLQAGDYTPAQIDGALGTVLGLDTQLIADRTYFIAESTNQNGRKPAGCGGWSKRKTLFGADHGPGRALELLDPSTDAAKVRAIFVHPDFARRGLGSLILATVENAAREAGFSRFEMGSTLTGVPLYRLRGYVEVERIAVPLGNGEALPVVRMVKKII
jgi:GNAT superfamily N-acetyltransferase